MNIVEFRQILLKEIERFVQMAYIHAKYICTND